MMKMKQPNKNNVFLENGKYFVKKIKQCDCRRKDDELYDLECRIKERGYHFYNYQKANELKQASALLYSCNCKFV